MTGYTVVEREPEWDDYSVSQALAYAAWRNACCGSCGQTGGFREFPSDARDVTWPDGTKVRVSVLRCLFCGAQDAVRGDWQAQHENDKRIPGQAMDADGRIWVAHRPDD